jgi:hypothetical protein
LNGVPKDSLITQTGKNEKRARENQIAHSCKTQNKKKMEKPNGKPAGKPSKK